MSRESRLDRVEAELDGRPPQPIGPYDLSRLSDEERGFLGGVRSRAAIQGTEATLSRLSDEELSELRRVLRKARARG